MGVRVFMEVVVVQGAGHVCVYMRLCVHVIKCAPAPSSRVYSVSVLFLGLCWLCCVPFCCRFHFVAEFGTGLALLRLFIVVRMYQHTFQI